LKFSAIHQIAAGFAAGDAISLEAVAIRDLCRALGVESEIFVPAENVAAEEKHLIRPLEEYRSASSELLICHYSIQSPATEVFRRSGARKAVIYHNITPASFFRPYDERMVCQLEEGRRELAAVAGLADAVWADSAFNASELAALGMKNVRVLPLLFSVRAFDVPADPVVLQRFSGPSQKILFVGRLAPNKGVEELIEAFAWYHNSIERRSELILVGSEHSCPKYYSMLRMYAGELDLMSVSFVRYASPAGLIACYQRADLFVSTSRHEGYCLPVVEAMYKGVPVIARNTGGVPEAMDGAGVLFDEAKPEELAVLMARVISDGALRSEILAGQQARIQRILARPVQEEFLGLLNAL
jgi:glycosyltransferase involved in cell wall biosynthesis